MFDTLATTSCLRTCMHIDTQVTAGQDMEDQLLELLTCLILFKLGIILEQGVNPLLLLSLIFTHVILGIYNIKHTKEDFPAGGSKWES